MLPAFETLENRDCPSTIVQDGTTLVFDDIGGVYNSLSITQIESGGTTKFRFVDGSGEPISLPSEPPEGWEIVDGAAEIPTAGITLIKVNANDGDDNVDGSTLSISLWLNGGADNDTLLGGYANDEIYGNADSDTLYGGPGDDRVIGGDG